MAKLSAEQLELKLRAYNTKGKKKKQQIKQQRSNILHQLHKQAKLLDRQQLNSQLEYIESAKDSARMFKAVRELARIKKKSTISVVDANNNIIARDTEAADTIAAHFNKKLNNNGAGPPQQQNATHVLGPLQHPITTAEVGAAAKTLQNGRAVGPDNIPAELLK